MMISECEMMISECEALCVEVSVKSPEFVREIHEDSRISYTIESLLSLSETEICKELPAEFDQSTIRELRISYTREDLISLAELDVCKELPDGFDQSIVSVMQDAYDIAHEVQELQDHKSVSAGDVLEVSTQAPERWDAFKLTTVDTITKSSSEIQEPQGQESLSFGRKFGVSTEKSEERWDRFKLNSADSKSTAFDKLNCNQLRRPWNNPTTTGFRRSASQNPEQSSILGSGCVTKPSSGGSEMLELPASNCLLSRCSQPYRPPSYFKAMRDSGSQKHDLHYNKTFGHAEGSSKQRATEERWRKESFELKTEEPIQAIVGKHKSNGHAEKVIPKSGACALLEDHSALQVLNHFTSAPPIFPSVTASAEPPCTTLGTPEDCLSEGSLNNQPLIQGQEVIYQAEKLQPQILEGGRFSALIVLKDAEDVDRGLTDEACLACDRKPPNGEKILSGGMVSDEIEKKGLRTQVSSVSKNKENKTSNNLSNNTVGKTAIKSFDEKASVSSEVSVKPSARTCNSREGFVAQQQKVINIPFKDFQKGLAIQKSDGDHLATDAEVSDGSVSQSLLSSHCTKQQDIIMDSKDSCVPGSKSAHWFSGNDNAPSNSSSWPDLSRNNIWKTSTGVLSKENFLVKGESRQTSLYAQEFQAVKGTKTAISECVSSPLVERNDCNSNARNHEFSHHWLPELEVRKTRELGQAFGEVTKSENTGGVKFNAASEFGGEADSNFEINLPDEDSLITVDDTYIFQEDKWKQSPERIVRGGKRTVPFSGPNKPMQTANLWQNPILPSAWFHDSQLNIAELFVNPSNTPAHLRAPPEFHDPWSFYHYNYDSFTADVFSNGHLPVMPQAYGPPLQDFLPPAHGFYPHLNNNLPAEPPPYHHFHQMPCHPKEPDLLESLPQSYQGNVNPAYMGMRDRHGKENIRPSFSQILQMQIEMAHMKLRAAPDFSQRDYNKPISNQHW